MKIKVKKKDLVEAIDIVSGSINRSVVNPILEYFLIEAKNEITFHGTDLVVGIKCESVGIDIVEEGSILLNCKKMLEIAKSLTDGDVEITCLKDFKVEIVGSSGEKFEINGLPSDDFPVIDFTLDDMIKVNRTDLFSVLSKTMFSMSKDTFKYNICGIHINGNNVVSTDGYRLSIAEHEIEGIASSITIPSSGISEIYRAMKKSSCEFIGIKSFDDRMLFNIDKTTYSVRLIDKTYPQYEVIVPKSEPNATATICGDIISSLKRINIISSVNNRPVVFDFNNGCLKLSTEDSEIGQAEETVQVESSGVFSFAINAGYLIDILSVAGDVVIEYYGEDNAVVCKSGKDVFIIMPMLVK